jgi:ABC-type dipeptide/oligopeptide/nickel transport system ATPase subunit
MKTGVIKANHATYPITLGAINRIVGDPDTCERFYNALIAADTERVQALDMLFRGDLLHLPDDSQPKSVGVAAFTDSRALFCNPNKTIATTTRIWDRLVPLMPKDPLLPCIHCGGTVLRGEDRTVTQNKAITGVAGEQFIISVPIATNTLPALFGKKRKIDYQRAFLQAGIAELIIAGTHIRLTEDTLSAPLPPVVLVVVDHARAPFSDVDRKRWEQIARRFQGKGTLLSKADTTTLVAIEPFPAHSICSNCYMPQTAWIVTADFLEENIEPFLLDNSPRSKEIALPFFDAVSTLPLSLPGTWNIQKIFSTPISKLPAEFCTVPEFALPTLSRISFRNLIKDLFPGERSLLLLSECMRNDSSEYSNALFHPFQGLTEDLRRKCAKFLSERTKSGCTTLILDRPAGAVSYPHTTIALTAATPEATNLEAPIPPAPTSLTLDCIVNREVLRASLPSRGMIALVGAIHAGKQALSIPTRFLHEQLLPLFSACVEEKSSNVSATAAGICIREIHHISPNQGRRLTSLAHYLGLPPLIAAQFAGRLAARELGLDRKDFLPTLIKKGTLSFPKSSTAILFHGHTIAGIYARTFQEWETLFAHERSIAAIVRVLRGLGLEMLSPATTTTACTTGEYLRLAIARAALTARTGAAIVVEELSEFLSAEQMQSSLRLLEKTVQEKSGVCYLIEYDIATIQAVVNQIVLINE